MLSFTTRRNLFGKFTNDTSDANLSYGDTLMNEYEKRILNKYNLHFLEATFTEDTVALQQFYLLPNDLKKVITSPTITVGDTTYTIAEAPNRRFWDSLNDTTQFSDVPQYFFIFAGEVGFYPIPSTTANTIDIQYLKTQTDLNTADVIAGIVTTATNASTAIAGSGTAWSSPMAGRFLRITSSDAADSGDGEWYKIASVESNTALTLVNKYTGTSISTGATAFTIGQMSNMPNGYDTLPIYHAANIYWTENGDLNKADRFKLQRDEMDKQLIGDQGNKTTDPTIVDDRIDLRNPNLFLRQ